MTDHPNHGGARAGAGRKRGAPSSTMRVPDKYRFAVTRLIDFLNEVEAGTAYKSTEGYVGGEAILTGLKRHPKLKVTVEATPE